MCAWHAALKRFLILFSVERKISYWGNSIPVTWGKRKIVFSTEKKSQLLLFVFHFDFFFFIQKNIILKKIKNHTDKSKINKIKFISRFCYVMRNSLHQKLSYKNYLPVLQSMLMAFWFSFFFLKLFVWILIFEIIKFFTPLE